tara:strand:+ start:84 stop:947 length:864 start_codon:yes stop_codon:yes gene_type:complete
MLIDGKQISKNVLREVASEAAIIYKNLKRKPGLNIILVGNNPASETYVRSKLKVCESVGISGVLTRLDSSASFSEIKSEIDNNNNNSEIDGILIQLPLPGHLDSEKLINYISSNKDVDGLTIENIGLLNSDKPNFIPATPYGIIKIFENLNINLQGKNIVIIGRSNIVGRPLFSLLSGKKYNSTVTLCNSYTQNLIKHTLNADILIVAAGKPGIINGEMVKEGVIVIDVGTNRVEDLNKKSGYRLIGDVDFESVSKKASLITPVPGGVGPMTIAMLMKNICFSASQR